MEQRLNFVLTTEERKYNEYEVRAEKALCAIKTTIIPNVYSPLRRRYQLMHITTTKQIKKNKKSVPIATFSPTRKRNQEIQTLRDQLQVF